MVSKESVVVIGRYSAEHVSRTTIPMYASAPAAGFPAPGDDLVEKALDINDLIQHNPVSTFFVRVQGDSMEGARIFSGDVLVVDRAVHPASGKIVVAAVYGEMVVKRLKVSTGRMYLCSENDAYASLEIQDHEDCYIWGVVVGIVRTV